MKDFTPPRCTVDGVCDDDPRCFECKPQPDGVPPEVVAEIRALLKESPPFRPFAVFDAALDTLVVQLSDCSYCEERIDPRLSLMRNNYGREEYIGFQIHGLAHLCGGDTGRLAALLEMVAAIDSSLSQGREDQEKRT
jgi:hypothetical protein